MQSLPAPGGECPAIVSVWGEGRRDYNGADTQSGDGPEIFRGKGHIKTVVVYTKFKNTHGEPPVGTDSSSIDETALIFVNKGPVP